jgi:PTH1 family peptidyl-tRNA hydrolase
MFFRKPAAPISNILVFLGNPGPRYEGTRHNAGFLVADKVAEACGAKINKNKYNSLTAVSEFGGKRVLLLKPQTYMNLVGGPVSQAMRFYKMELASVIAVSDDVTMPPGKIRIRRSGSAGGHNGLKDIIKRCGGEEFPRIKIGVGAPPREDYEMIDWVLSKPDEPDAKLIAEAAANARDALEIMLSQSIEAAMAKYN